MTDPRHAHQIRSAIRPLGGVAPIDARTAVFTFVGAWLAAQIASTIVLLVLGAGDAADVTETSIAVLAAGLVAAWACYLGGMWLASDRAGSGSPVDDYGITFEPIDVIGFGIGVLSQLVLVRVVYLPLEAFWPDTFTEDRLQENARSLVDRADGSSMVLLFLVVVIGAPVVEELFYRGPLQRPLAARFDDGVVLVGVAAVFALVHFRPVEYPGLFAFGLVLGLAALRTGRLGMAVTTHVGFNLTGLLLAS